MGLGFSFGQAENGSRTPNPVDVSGPSGELFFLVSAPKGNAVGAEKMVKGKQMRIQPSLLTLGDVYAVRAWMALLLVGTKKDLSFVRGGKALNSRTSTKNGGLQAEAFDGEMRCLEKPDRAHGSDRDLKKKRIEFCKLVEEPFGNELVEAMVSKNHSYRAWI